MSNSRSETSDGRIRQDLSTPPSDSEDVMEYMFGDDVNENVRILYLSF